jgi:hypothetical protein
VSGGAVVTGTTLPFAAGGYQGAADARVISLRAVFIHPVRSFIVRSAVTSAHARLKRGSRMGRGRQKAKHTKVARELKYFSPDTNYTALERELSSSSKSDEDAWAEYADKYGDDEFDESDEDESKTA